MLPGLLRSPRLITCLKDAGSKSSTRSSRYVLRHRLWAYPHNSVQHTEQNLGVAMYGE